METPPARAILVATSVRAASIAASSDIPRAMKLGTIPRAIALSIPL